MYYVNELSELLKKSGFGGNMGGTIINHMLYVDDICIVSLSSSGLQQLLNICRDYCELHDLTLYDPGGGGFKSPPPPIFCSHAFNFRAALLCVGDLFQKIV